MPSRMTSASLRPVSEATHLRSALRSFGMYTVVFCIAVYGTRGVKMVARQHLVTILFAGLMAKASYRFRVIVT